MKQVVLFLLFLLFVVFVAASTAVADYSILDFLVLNEKVGQEYDEPFLVKGWPVVEWCVEGELPIAATRHCFVDSRPTDGQEPPRIFITIGPVEARFAGRTAAVNEIAVWRITESRDYFATFYFEGEPGLTEAEIQEALTAPLDASDDLDINQDHLLNPEDLEVMAQAMPPPPEHLNDFDWLALKEPVSPETTPDLTPKRPVEKTDTLAVRPTGKLASTWGAIKKRKG